MQVCYWLYCTIWYGYLISKPQLRGGASIFSCDSGERRSHPFWFAAVQRREWFQHFARGGVRVTVCWYRSSSCTKHNTSGLAAQKLACQYCPRWPLHTLTHRCISGHILMLSLSFLHWCTNVETKWCCSAHHRAYVQHWVSCICEISVGWETAFSKVSKKNWCKCQVYRTHYLLTLHLWVWFNVSTDHMDRELCKYNIAVLSCATSVTLINFIGMFVLIIKSLTCLIY